MKTKKNDRRKKLGLLLTKKSKGLPKNETGEKLLWSDPDEINQKRTEKTLGKNQVPCDFTFFDHGFESGKGWNDQNKSKFSFVGLSLKPFSD